MDIQLTYYKFTSIILILFLLYAGVAYADTSSENYTLKSISFLNSSSRQTTASFNVTSVITTGPSSSPYQSANYQIKQGPIYLLNLIPNLTNLSPNGSIFNNNPILKWTYKDPENNPQTKYHIQVSNDNFKSVIFDSSVIYSNITQHILTNLPDSDTAYSYRIRVCDSFGDFSNWFLVQNGFKIDTLPPVISENAVGIDAKSFDIFYSEEVIGADNPANYTIGLALGNIIQITNIGNNTFRLTVEKEPSSGVIYKITPNFSNIKDKSGNPLAPDKFYIKFLGGSRGPVILLSSLKGKAPNDYFGLGVACGNFNNDLFNDLAVPAFNKSLNGPSRGHLSIFSGKADTIGPAPNLSLDGSADYEQMGFSLAVGNFNKDADNYADIAIGIPYGGTQREGKVAVHLGAKDGINPAPSFVFLGPMGNSGFGKSLAAVDLNKDGSDDLIVGAPYFDANGPDRYGSLHGKIFAYLGGNKMDAVADWSKNGEAAGDMFGAVLAGGGDINGDGYLDLAVSALGSDKQAEDSGRACVYTGAANINDIKLIFDISGERAGDNFGAALSCAGDINRDAYADLIIGANKNDDGAEDAGKVYIYRGRQSLNSAPDVVWTGKAAKGLFGSAIDIRNDLNRDGYNDIIVSAPKEDNDSGKVFVYLGGASINSGSAAYAQISGVAKYDYFGLSLCAASDINGDGQNEFVASGSDVSGNNTVGRVDIFQLWSK